MAVARSIFQTVLIVALMAYAVDCSPTASAEQAMQCCKSMQCMRQHHRGQDRCKTMPTARVVIGQPTTASVSFAPVVFGMIKVTDVSVAVSSSSGMIAEHAHDPPLGSTPTTSPLRI